MFFMQDEVMLILPFANVGSYFVSFLASSPNKRYLYIYARYTLSYLAVKLCTTSHKVIIILTKYVFQVIVCSCVLI